MEVFRVACLITVEIWFVMHKLGVPVVVVFITKKVLNLCREFAHYSRYVIRLIWLTYNLYYCSDWCCRAAVTTDRTNAWLSDGTAWSHWLLHQRAEAWQSSGLWLLHLALLVVWLRQRRNRQIIFPDYSYFKLVSSKNIVLHTLWGIKNTPKFFCRNFYNTWPISIEIDMQCLG